MAIESHTKLAKATTHRKQIENIQLGIVHQRTGGEKSAKVLRDIDRETGTE